MKSIPTKETIRKMAIECVCQSDEPKTITEINIVNLLIEFGNKLMDKLYEESSFKKG